VRGVSGRSTSMKMKTTTGGTTKTLVLSGVGYRYSVYSRSSPWKGVTLPRPFRILVMDVGTSHPRCYLLPRWVTPVVDSSKTKLTRSLDTPGLGETFPVLEMVQWLNMAAFDVESSRRRSAFTGQGVINPLRTYPKLKSTKTSSKK
jgi:hypothetical protein